MKKYKFTYEKSGVNINAANKFVNYISKLNNKTNFNNIGNFGSINKIPQIYKKPLLVTSTDGVGTKIEIANKLEKFHTIGIDLVAMCVNDIIVQGAEPFVFLDYISVDKIDLGKLKKIVNGIIQGCKLSNCQLVGGETAEMPGTYTKGKFDMAGFSVGLVESSKVLKKKNIKVNDVIMAIPSSGLHSNGFSLVREIIKKNKINIKKNNFLKKELLKPTKIYVNEILSLLKRNVIHGCANITGGGIPDNLERIIPNGCCAKINMSKIKTKPIFTWIKKRGVSDRDMIRTFNCGVGFCIVTKKQNVNKIYNYFDKSFKPYVIGKIIKNKKKIIIDEKIKWKINYKV